jgi:hypothetical protein
MRSALEVADVFRRYDFGGPVRRAHRECDNQRSNMDKDRIIGAAKTVAGNINKR